MIKKIKSPDFDRERAVFFMPSGAGPCRFGQYNILHRLVLHEIGLSGIPVYSPNQDGSFYRELGIVGKDFTRIAWRGIVAIDILMKCLHETRPYELNPGQSEELYSKYLQEIRSFLINRNGDSLIDLLMRIRDDFASIPRSDEKRPLVGIVGEIFVRHNRFANENIIKKIEALGGEVWLAPIEEWLYYINAMALRKNIDKWRKDYLNRDTIKDILNTVITRRVQDKIEKELSRPFEGVLKTLHEPSTKELLRNASSYIHDSFEGEAVLSIGKSIDFIRRGASGIISTMPFGCMPGTIVDAIMKGLRNDTGIPCMSIAYDGVESTCSEIQIEAFMYQVHDYFRKRQ
jgi:predicted nucleotide-binding protein (sugar kinase/HSP70/actin superfamily)